MTEEQAGQIIQRLDQVIAHQTVVEGYVRDYGVGIATALGHCFMALCVIAFACIVTSMVVTLKR